MSKQFAQIFNILFFSVIIAGCDNSPLPNPEPLDQDSHLMLVGPEKYVILLNENFQGIDASHWACSLERNPSIEDPNAIVSQPVLFEQLEVLQNAGIAKSVIFGLQPSTRYYCRPFKSAVGYGKEISFKTGPDIGQRLTHWEEEVNANSRSSSSLYYDSLGRLALSHIWFSNLTDFRFGSQSYGNISFYEYNTNVVSQFTVRLDPSNQFEAKYPQDYTESIRYTYRDRRIISEEWLSFVDNNTYFYAPDRITKVEEREWKKDSIVMDFSLGNNLALFTTFRFKNGTYELLETVKPVLDPSKKDPFYDLQNQQLGYGNYPLIIGFDVAGTLEPLEYSFNGSWPISFGNRRYGYTIFD